MLSTDEAIRRLRADPRNAQLVRDSYWHEDVHAAAAAFASSAEFEALRALLGNVSGKRVVDLGTGNGIAAHAFARAGATVIAIDPNLDAEFGAGAARKIVAPLAGHVIGAEGEQLPLQERSVDIVYARQVLHHSRDLAMLVREAARILKPGGVFIATREHVVDDAAQLRRFLRQHPVHRLAGGESAYPERIYTSSMTEAGLRVETTLGPWESVINAFPTARNETELRNLPRVLFKRFFGPAGRIAAALPLAAT